MECKELGKDNLKIPFCMITFGTRSTFYYAKKLIRKDEEETE